MARTAAGWTLALESGAMPAVTSVTDDGNLLGDLAAGDRIAVDGATQCQPFSGCKEYAVITKAADGTFIAASYSHDSGLPGFTSALGVTVSLEPVCRSAEPGGSNDCYPGAVRVQNRLRFGDDPATVDAGASGSIALAGKAVHVAAGQLITLVGGSGSSNCLDAGSFWRGAQVFSLAR